MDERTTIADLAKIYRMDVRTLIGKLGPRPHPRPESVARGGGLRHRILEVLRRHHGPMRASLLVTNCGGAWKRQSIYAEANKLVDDGLIRRIRHGYYEAVPSETGSNRLIDILRE